MPTISRTAFPNWPAIFKLADPALADFIRQGDADRHYRMSLGWPELFTAENPYADDVPIPLATLRAEFGILVAKDSMGIDEIWEALARKLRFSLFSIYNGDDRRSRGNFEISAASFTGLTAHAQNNVIAPFHGGVISFGNAHYVICVINLVDQTILVTPADRFNLTE